MRGFTNIFRVESTPVNVQVLERFESGSEVTVENLVAVGIVRKKNTNIKILGNDKLTKKLNVTAHAFSNTADQ